MQDAIILGAGGFAREVMWVTVELKKYRVLAFLDETIGVSEKKEVHSIPVVKSLDSYLDKSNVNQMPHLICGTGSNSLRQRWVRQFGTDFQFETLIHPSARIGPKVNVGVGTIITAGCVLTVDILVGNFVNINLNCTVGHDSILEDFCNLSPGCNISGNVKIGESCDLGTGAIVIPKKTIGKRSVIGAGAVVLSDIPEDSVAVGIPAKVIRTI